MATSSITHDFVFETDEQVLRFINAIEESRRNPYVHEPVAFKELKGEELKEFMRERKRMLEEEKNAKK